ncbi:MAG: hypothetical protein OEY78_06505 [Gammaproteobacteria bacterium]|nr:hypothetical protein [Gammaproteobacteria bacterium]
MNKTVLFFATLSLAACSSTGADIKFSNKSPRGITISNVYKESHSRAYQSAEKHCAKYSKVPRKLKITRESAEYATERVTLVFECIRPSN